MNNSFEYLCSNLNNIHKEEELTSQFASIADTLFKHYGIKCGDMIYHFAEIEFYYYHKNVFCQDWNTITYPRQNKRSGDLFYHLSGVDICFESSRYTDNDIAFGGILIRSLTLLDEQKRMVIFGPLTCKNEILNNSGSEMPKLCKIEDEYHCSIKQTYMQGIPLPKEKQKKHCFYDESIGKQNWIREVETFDYKNITKKSYHSRYKTNRF